MSFLLDMKKGFKKLFGSEMFQNRRIRRYIWALAIFLLITLFLTIEFIPNTVKLKAGQVAPHDIKAPVTTTYIDKKSTEEKRQQAAEQVAKVWKTDPAITPQVQNEISTFFNLVRKYRQMDYLEDSEGNIPSGQQPLSVEEKVQIINQEADLEVPVEGIKWALEMPIEELNLIEEFVKNLSLTYLDRGIQPTHLENEKTKMAMDIEKSDFTGPVKDLLKSVGYQVLQPNIILDVEETRRRQEEAMAKIVPVERTVQQGQTIIRSGNVVTEEDIAMLESLGLQRPRVNYRTIIGLIAIILIMMGITIFYLKQYHRKVFRDESSTVLLGLLTILIIAIAKLVSVAGVQWSPAGYIVPIAAVSILISILVNSSIAIFFTMVLSFLILVVTGGGAAEGAVLVISGLTGVFSVSKVSQRSDLVRAGFYVSGATALTIFSYSLTQNLSWLMVLKATTSGIINGISAAIMANGLLPYLENVFGITSAVKLLELSNPNQPILKQLLMEAPGTYHHSLLVGNLVEAAADKVGADSLLARVGAYYHDIGKIKRPYFFTDNQFGGENPHDKLSPGLSTLIIKSHVKDGVESAKKYKLPKPVIDIIQQHHGTNLISFFYQEALNDDKYENVDEAEFRYDGPKPQTREAALIMLADICEAAVRSKQFNRSNHSRIEALVRELIRKKLEEGQLDECDLTLKDLDKIATSFTKVLTGIYHHRIEYPENIAKEMKMKGVQGTNGNTNK